MKSGPTSLQFFAHLRWLDGTPLLDCVEPYRRDIFTKALDSFDDRGRPLYSMVVSGRAKKNWKSCDLILAALFVLVIRRSVQGSDCYALANDSDQSADNLALAKKLIAANPDLAAEIDVLATELRLRDGSASLRILPAQNVAGQHGRSFAFCGFDEIHAYKDWALLEALQPDPTRPDCLQWITSYASLFNTAGAPLHDLMQIGKSGKDSKLLFSWYSGDLCTDPKFADLPPLERANPSLPSWPDGLQYLEQQQVRLPTGRYRRLHLNLPGSPEGAAFDQAAILKCVVTGRRSLPYEDGRKYVAAVDMSGGSSDDAVLAIAHRDGRTVVLDKIVKQIGTPPFDPRYAVARFCDILHEWKIAKVYGDAFSGMTFRLDFQKRGIAYEVRTASASLLYEKLEPVINAGELELLDQPTLIEQLVSLIWRGTKIGHESNSHDDWANSCALAVSVVRAAITRPMPKYHPPYAVSKTGVIADPTLPSGEPQQRQPTATTTELFYQNGGYAGSRWPGSDPFASDW